jgi:protein SCO1/2
MSMGRIARSRVAGFVAAAALCLAAASPAAAQGRWGADYFTNTTLTTHDGKTVRFYDDLLKGKIVAINLIYTTCKFACPLETARLAQVQKVLGDRMGKDVFFYSITIDPEHDTPDVLKDYAQKFKAGPGWLFLTGKPSDIETLSRKIGLYSEPTVNADGHTPNLLVGNEVTGQWMRNSGLDNPKFLARTIGDWLNSWQTRKAVAPTSYANAPKMTLDRGEYTFRNHCAACHTVGEGDRIGPDLAGVTKTRSRAWLTRFIIEPDKVLAEKDPIATELYKKFKNIPMPNLALSHADANVLLDFLAKKPAASGELVHHAAKTTAAAAAPAPAPAPAAGTPAAGGIRGVVDPYLRIHDALSADALIGVKTAAYTLAAAASRLGPSAVAVHSAAVEFERVTDVKSARESFGRLTEALLRHAKASKASIGDDVNVAFCPMVKKYWLQKGTKIRNPYYGKSMLECGRLTEGLPAI